jgi:hypothetical protein
MPLSLVVLLFQSWMMLLHSHWMMLLHSYWMQLLIHWLLAGSPWSAKGGPLRGRKVLELVC